MPCEILPDRVTLQHTTVGVSYTTHTYSTTMDMVRTAPPAGVGVPHLPCKSREGMAETPSFLSIKGLCWCCRWPARWPASGGQQRRTATRGVPRESRPVGWTVWRASSRSGPKNSSEGPYRDSSRPNASELSLSRGSSGDAPRLVCDPAADQHQPPSPVGSCCNVATLIQVDVTVDA